MLIRLSKPFRHQTQQSICIKIIVKDHFPTSYKRVTTLSSQIGGKQWTFRTTLDICHFCSSQ